MQIEVKNIKVGSLISMDHFRFESGLKYLIQGPSGVGKTTLLHLLGGLLPPDQGQVLVDNEDIYGRSESLVAQFRKKNIGFVFQKLNLIEHLTAFENIILGAQSNRDPEDIFQILEQLDIRHKSDVLTGYLSLGEQQRVAVARCLVQQAHIILADEPTSSLDDENSKKIIQSLLHQRPKATVIVVSHDQRLKPYFDQVISFKGLMS